MANKFPKNRHWSGNDKKCPDCQEDLPTSSHIPDRIHGGKLLMDPICIGLAHFAVCPAKKTQQEIISTRNNWEKNNVWFAEEVAKQKAQGLNPTKESVIESLKKQKKYYDFGTSQQHNNTSLLGEKNLEVFSEGPKWDPNKLGPLTEERLQNLEATVAELYRMVKILVQRTEPVG